MKTQSKIKNRNRNDNVRYTYPGSFLKYLMNAIKELHKILRLEPSLPAYPFLLVVVRDQVPETILGRFFQGLLVKVGMEAGKIGASK